MKLAALIVAGIIFLIVSALHFFRYAKKLTIKLGNFTVPLIWSIYAGIVSLLLTLWMFMAAT